MTHVSPLLAVLSLAASVLAAGPEEFLQAAIADAKRMPEELRHSMRYAVRPPGMMDKAADKEWATFRKVNAFHVRSISRDFDLEYLPKPVGPYLLRINLLDHEWPRELWEKLAATEPYFHARANKVVAERVEKVEAAPAEAVETVAIEGVQFYRDGDTANSLVEIQKSDVKAGETIWVKAQRSGGIKRVTVPGVKVLRESYRVDGETRFRISRDGGRNWFAEEQPAQKIERKAQAVQAAAGDLAHAPILPAKLITELGLLLNSDCPIVRADWFLDNTGAQFGRKGTGYYDFLGFKTRDDIERFCGLDKAAAKRSRKEFAAIIQDNPDGPAPNNRGILAEGTLNGSFWRTLDVEDNDGPRNAIATLDGKLAHQAEEIYGPRPDGLFVYGASDAEGKLQDKVPVKFAADHTSFKNRVEIEPMFSCVTCHVEGIRPVDDWVRKTFRGPLELAGKDYQETKRLRLLYLRELDDKIKQSVDEYSKALKTVNGFTPKENADAYGAEKRRYAFTALGLAETAAELWTDEKTWEAALTVYARDRKARKLPADPILTPLLIGGKVRREHWVERYGLAQEIYLRGKP